MLIISQVWWEFDDGMSFQQYPNKVSATIELAFNQKQKTVEFGEEDPNTHAIIVTCKIDFDAMEEYANGDTSNPRKVRRVESENVPDSIKLPKCWSAMSPADLHVLVTLDPASNEYQQVAKKFASSMKPGGYTAIDKVKLIS